MASRGRWLKVQDVFGRNGATGQAHAHSGRLLVLAHLAVVEAGHTVFGAVGLQPSAVQIRTAWDHGLQVVADSQELFGDGQIAVHREDFAAQEALQRRLGLPSSDHAVVAWAVSTARRGPSAP